MKQYEEKYRDQIAKYRMVYDIHTHTIFSHGKGTIEDNVKAAKGKNLSAVGISDHGPGHKFYGIKHKDLQIMRGEIDRLKAIYPEMEIMLGIEANIIDPTGKLDHTKEDLKYLDYVLAGYHYGIFGDNPLVSSGIHFMNLLSSSIIGSSNRDPGMRRRRMKKLKNINTELVIKALHENEVKVLTHPGDKGPFDLCAIAEACRETGTLMEISNWHEAPRIKELKALRKIDVSFIVSSDAHSPSRVGTFEKGLARAIGAGIDPARIVNLASI